MSIARRLPVWSAALLSLLALAACAAGHSEHDKSLIVVGERNFKDASLDYMYAIAQRTMRDMHLSRQVMTKDENSAFLDFTVPATEFGEMAMEIKPTDAHTTQVTMFSKDPHDRDAAAEVLDDLTAQIKADRNTPHGKAR